jgi:hypothetical protein
LGMVFCTSQYDGPLAPNPDAMAMTLRKPRLGPERRGALGILADAPRGLTEGLMLVHGVTAETIASLVRDGLATARREPMKAAGLTIEVTRVKITDAGQQAIEG